MSEPKKRKSFTIAIKLEAIEYAEKNSKEAAARRYGVDAKSIRDWCHKKTQLMETPGKKMRIDGNFFFHIFHKVELFRS